MKKTFTLIETIVTLAILGLITPIIFTIIFVISREEIKTKKLSQIKREGDYIINNISYLIKNSAVSIHSSSPPDETNIICNNESFILSFLGLNFKDKQNNWFRLFLNNNKISSYSSIINSSLDLNSNNVKIYNFSIACENNSTYSSAIVSINFDICYKGSKSDCSLNSQEDPPPLHYQTKIKLRNY